MVGRTIEEFAMECAKKIAKWLAKKKLNSDVSIYVNSGRYKVLDNGNLQFELFAEAKDYIEFAGDFLSMSFEGPLYNVFNFYNSSDYDNKLVSEFSKICEKYGYYYEMCYSWALSLYEM